MEYLRERLERTGLQRIEMSLQEKTAVLEKSKLGSGMGWQELQTVAGFCAAYVAQPGVTICRQGEQSDFLCLISKGRVAIVKEDLHHTVKEIASVGPGQTVGEMALIDGEPRSASVVVQTGVTLLVLSDASFERMAEEAPRLWGRILLRLAQTLSKRLRQTSGILAEYLAES